MSNSLERSLWISLAVLLGLTVLVILTLVGLGGRVPALRPLGGATNGFSPDWFTLQDASQWFQANELARPTGQTNVLDPFFTAYFQPPPPPSTKPVELTYLGFVDSEGRPRRALIQVDKATRLFTPGLKVVADHAVQDIARRTLILTNGSGATNVLEFRIKKVLEIPAR